MVLQLSERTGPGFWHNLFLLPKFCNLEQQKMLWQDCAESMDRFCLLHMRYVPKSPDLDSNCLTLWRYSWKNFWKKLIWEKHQLTAKKHVKLSRIPWRGYIIACCKRVSLKHWNLQNALLAILIASWVNIKGKLHILGGTLSYFQ